MGVMQGPAAVAVAAAGVMAAAATAMAVRTRRTRCLTWNRWDIMHFSARWVAHRRGAPPPPPPPSPPPPLSLFPAADGFRRARLWSGCPVLSCPLLPRCEPACHSVSIIHVLVQHHTRRLQHHTRRVQHHTWCVQLHTCCVQHHTCACATSYPACTTSYALVRAAAGRRDPHVCCIISIIHSHVCNVIHAHPPARPRRCHASTVRQAHLLVLWPCLVPALRAAVERPATLAPLHHRQSPAAHVTHTQPRLGLLSSLLRGHHGHLCRAACCCCACVGTV